MSDATWPLQKPPIQGNAHVNGCVARAHALLKTLPHHDTLQAHFGSDGLQRTAENAVAWAVDLALQFGSRLTLLHAYWLPPMAYAAFAEGVLCPIDDMASGAEKKSFDVALTGIKKRGLDVESVFVVGEPRRTILSTTVERGVDLIVMGTHGRRGLSHALLGSVAEAIVRLSPVPVLTVSGKDVGR